MSVVVAEWSKAQVVGQWGASDPGSIPWSGRYQDNSALGLFGPKVDYSALDYSTPGLFGFRTIRHLDYSVPEGMKWIKRMELLKKPCPSELVNYDRKIGLLKSECGIVVHEVSRRSIVLPKAAHGGWMWWLLNHDVDDRTVLWDAAYKPVELQKVCQRGCLQKLGSLTAWICAVWNPHLLKDIHELEMVQRKATHFVCKGYRREDGVVTGLLSKLEWPTLQERRVQSRLTLMYKTVHKLFALDVHDDLRTSTRNTRRSTKSSLTYTNIATKKGCYKYSFVPRTISV